MKKETLHKITTEDYERELRIWLDRYLDASPGTQYDNSTAWGIDEKNEKRNPRYIQLLKSLKKKTPWKIEHLFKIAKGIGKSPSDIVLEIEKALDKKFR